MVDDWDMRRPMQGVPVSHSCECIAKKMFQQSSDLHIQTDPQDWAALKGCRPLCLTHYHPSFHWLHHPTHTTVNHRFLFWLDAFYLLLFRPVPECIGSTLRSCQSGNVVAGNMWGEHYTEKWTLMTVWLVQMLTTWHLIVQLCPFATMEVHSAAHTISNT